MYTPVASKNLHFHLVRATAAHVGVRSWHPPAAAVASVCGLRHTHRTRVAAGWTVHLAVTRRWTPELAGVKGRGRGLGEDGGRGPVRAQSRHRRAGGRGSVLGLVGEGCLQEDIGLCFQQLR